MDRAYQIGITVLLCFGLGVFTGVIGTRVTEHVAIDWAVSTKVASDTMTAIGIFAAGLWATYLIQRRRSFEPRASLAHRAQLWNQGSDEILRLYVEVSNPSEVVIRPGDGNTRIQQPSVGIINAHQFAPDAWMDIEKIRHCLGYEDVHIEPKESETFTHDIKLPADIRYLQIATEMACTRTIEMKVDRALGRPTVSLDLPKDADRWTLTTLIDVNELRTRTARSASFQRTNRDADTRRDPRDGSAATP
jgi:hypothetical protein